MDGFQTCENCGNAMTFEGYEYWENDENGDAIILPELITDNPDLTPEDEAWYCPTCDIHWCVLIGVDGTHTE